VQKNVKQITPPVMKATWTKILSDAEAIRKIESITGKKAQACVGTDGYYHFGYWKRFTPFEIDRLAESGITLEESEYHDELEDNVVRVMYSYKIAE
jgi:hypothetical protein